MDGKIDAVAILQKKDDGLVLELIIFKVFI